MEASENTDLCRKKKQDYLIKNVVEAGFDASEFA
jgi:hypothetical protein